MSSSWSPSAMAPQAGRTVVVTGATSGIGLVTARELAQAGARVVLAVRDTAKGDAVAATCTGDVEVRRLDLADLASVRAFADGWTGALDVLVNNAGVMALPERRTADGFEMQVGTNHLGPFALTNLLLPHVTDRVVTVASVAHRTGRIRLDDLNFQRGGYRPWVAYGQSKLANLLFTMELQRKLEDAASPVRSVAAHPGYSTSSLHLASELRIMGLVMRVGDKVLAQPAERGALPTLFAATEDLPGNSYVGPGGIGELRGRPTLVGRAPMASEPVMAEALWGLSEELTGVRFPLPLPA